MVLLDFPSRGRAGARTWEDTDADLGESLPLDQHVLTEFAIFTSAAAVWWFVAPVLARAPDPRMQDRNPDRFRRVVRFHRLWGFAAIALGAGAALAS